MGLVMGLASAALFGLSGICVKIGMRRQSVDNGHFMSVLVNVLTLGALLLLTTIPEWSWTGFAGFIVAGILATFLGRGTTLAAIRLIGPTRQSAILVSAPLFTAIIGWIVLGEAITLLQALGGVVVSLGLLILGRSRIQDETALVTTAYDGLGASSRGALTTIKRDGVRAAIDIDPLLRGFLVAVMSSVFFGAGFVARKWSLSYYPSAVAGAFFGAVTALSLILLWSARGRDLRRLLDDNLSGVPWWFVGGGVATSVALLLQFNAFHHLPAWIVSLLQGTQALWALLWAALFLRREEHIGRELLVAIVVVMCGVAIMTYRL